MPNRTICEALKELRTCHETRNYSYMIGLIEEIQSMGKVYTTTIELGKTTPSLDLETEVDATFETSHIDLDLIEKTIPKFIGDIEQYPPKFSAVKIDGKRAYKYARETSIYLNHEYSGKGRGLTLYQHLIDEIRKTPIHVLIACIARPNDASVALHEKLGFYKVGQLEEVGHKFDNYIDVGCWQLKL